MRARRRVSVTRALPADVHGILTRNGIKMAAADPLRRLRWQRNLTAVIWRLYPGQPAKQRIHSMSEVDMFCITPAPTPARHTPAPRGARDCFTEFIMNPLALFSAELRRLAFVSSRAPIQTLPKILSAHWAARVHFGYLEDSSWNKKVKMYFCFIYTTDKSTKIRRRFSIRKPHVNVLIKYLLILSYEFTNLVSHKIQLTTKMK